MFGLHFRQGAQQRHAQLLLHVVRVLDGVVQHVQQDGDAAAQHDAQDKGQGNAQALVGLERGAGHHGPVHDAGVGLLEAAGFAHALHAGEEDVVQLAVGVHLALQLLQLELLAVEVLHLGFAGLPGGLQLLLVAPGDLVLAADAAHHLAHLAGQLFVGGVQVGAGGDHLRVFGAVALAQLRHLALGGALLRGELADHRVLHHGGHGHQLFGAGVLHALHVFLDVLRFNARLAGVFQPLRQYLQLVAAQAGYALHAHQALALAKVLQGQLGNTQVLLQLLQPLAQPAGGLHRAGKAGFQVAVDKFLGEGVDDLRRQLRVGGLKLQVDDEAVFHRVHAEAAGHSVGDGLDQLLPLLLLGELHRGFFLAGGQQALQVEVEPGLFSTSSSLGRKTGCS